MKGRLNVQRTLAAVTVCAFASVAANEHAVLAHGQTPHSAVKPLKVTGVPTYGGQGEIGNMIFTRQETTATQAQYTGIIDRLEFPSGPSPDFYGRRFYLCTLKEAMDYVTKQQPTASTFKLQTNMKIYDKNQNSVADETSRTSVTSSMHGWNTTLFQGKRDIGLRLGGLPRGEYTLYVDTHLTYEYVKDRLTGRRDISNVLLASGKLPVIIR